MNRLRNVLACLIFQTWNCVLYYRLWHNLWKGPTVCRLICVLCHNFWTNYDLDLFSTSKWPLELQFCESYLCRWRKIGWKWSMATYYAASFLPHYRRALFLHLVVFNLWIMEVNDNFFTNFVFKQSIALLFGILLFSITKWLWTYYLRLL